MVAGKCNSCGLNLAELERGGRFAGLLTIGVAGVLITLALALDSVVTLPIWLLIVIWSPLTMGSVLFALRLYKTAGVYSQFAAQEIGDETP